MTPEAVAPAGAAKASLNADYARMSHVVNDGDDIAFLPPVSGG